MNISSDSLKNIFTGFNTAFKKGFADTPSHVDKIAMTTSSATSEERYGWIGRFPRIREWVGDRVIENLTVYDYSIKNKDYEATVSVSRNDIEDDRVGLYGPIFEHFGREAKEHPDRLVFDLLAAGFASKCYDGQYFFDADHPVTGENGAVGSVSNVQAGAETPWFLLDTSKALRPIVYQKRRDFALISKDQPDDDNVFHRKEFIYGTDGRCSVGYGLWQLAYASKAALTPENYEAARAAMTTLRGEGGRVLGIMPTLLIVPASLEGAGRRILKAQNKADGASNEWVESAELLVTPWLG
jgi:phage major head subunit gpT-like protein